MTNRPAVRHFAWLYQLAYWVEKNSPDSANQRYVQNTVEQTINAEYGCWGKVFRERA